MMIIQSKDVHFQGVLRIMQTTRCAESFFSWLAFDCALFHPYAVLELHKQNCIFLKVVKRFCFPNKTNAATPRKGEPRSYATKLTFFIFKMRYKA